MGKLGAMPLLTLLLLATQPGCATYTAIRMEGPKGDENVALGMDRAQVERLVQTAAVSEYREDRTLVARYQYSDGPPGITKIRSLVYVAGDLFTLFLSELIFWPIEVHADNRIKRVGIAKYDEKNKLVGWSIERLNGEVLAHMKVPEPPPALAPPEPDELAASLPEHTVVPPGSEEEPIEEAGFGPETEEPIAQVGAVR